jgi:oligosaccharide repeat unit polymerase
MPVVLVADKCLALLLSIMILGQAYVVRRFVGTWLFPACLFGLFWFAYTIIPLTILFWVPAEPYAVAYIFLSTLSFSVGCLAFDWKTAFHANAQKRNCAAAMYGSAYLRRVFYLLTVVCVVFLALDLSYQGISLHDVFFDLPASALTYASLLYTENLRDNIFGRLTAVLTYVGPILGGLVYHSLPTKTGRAVIIIFAILPSVLVALTHTSKGLLFYCVVIFYAGLLAYRLFYGTPQLFARGSVRATTLLIFAVVPIITTAFLLRGLSAIEDTEVLVSRLIASIASYSCGHLYAFADWFAYVIGRHSELTYIDQSATGGFYTFIGPFTLMGSSRVAPLGVYDDDFLYGGLLHTNIFTMFRGLITDFGFGGSLLFMLGAGLLCHWAFRTMLVAIRPVFTVVVFTFMIGFFYYSFIISALGWNRFYAAFVLVWLVLHVDKLIAQSHMTRSMVPGRGDLAVKSSSLP